MSKAASTGIFFALQHISLIDSSQFAWQLSLDLINTLFRHRLRFFPIELVWQFFFIGRMAGSQFGNAKFQM